MVVLLTFFAPGAAHAQVNRVDSALRVDDLITADSLLHAHDTAARNNTLTRTDTLSPRRDSLHADTTAAHLRDTSKAGQLADSLGIIISKDALPDVVKAEAVDSAVMDMGNNLFSLYGQAQVAYQDMKLGAAKVTYAQSSNIVTAEPGYDSLGNMSDKTTFSQGKESFTSDSMQYNFKSKRAIVRNVHSQYGEGYMYSRQVKRNPDQSIYGQYSVYTTCALDTPHFGIVAHKIKVIPGHLIVSGPANITIEGVPTPLWLPFGLFPITDKQRSGFMLPSYTIEQVRGLGLTNGGYYFYFNDHADLLTQATFYTRGSYAVNALTNYADIYHYRGQVNLSYALNKNGEDFEPGAYTQKDFMVVWRHQTDAKAKPGEQFNASVQAGTSSYYSNNSYDPNQILQNQLTSNISYSKNWIGTPFSLTVSALHSQNTQTRQVSVTLPSLNFHVAQLNPFQKKNGVGTHWYDKITFSYSFDALNKTNFYDTAFSFNTLGINQFQNGMHHTALLSASYTVLRYINMSFSVNYNEYWLTQRLYENYDDAARRIDSLQQYGFFTARDFNAGVQFSTRIYGMKLFEHGRLRGIRHVITPNVGVTYHPDFAASPFNYYYRTRLDSSQNYQYISPYQSSVVSYPPQGKAGLVTMGLNNNLQIKVRTNNTKDTSGAAFKNVTLIDALGITTAYNMAVDSFQWSPFALNFRTNVLDKVNISASANYDPYAFNYATGTRLRETMWERGTGIARFTGAAVALGANFHSNKTTGGAANPTNSQEYNRIARNSGYQDYVDFNIPWSINLSYTLTANKNYYIGRDTMVLSHNITAQGDFNLTERWKVSYSTGYNFSQHQLTFTSFDIYRDLHCWQMHLQVIPFGSRKSFIFTLNVKAAALQDLKLTRRRDYHDAVGY